MSAPPSFSGGSILILNEFALATRSSTFFGASGTDVNVVVEVVLHPRVSQEPVALDPISQVEEFVACVSDHR